MAGELDIVLRISRDLRCCPNHPFAHSLGANFKNGKIFEFSDSYKQGFTIHPNYESRDVMKICLQKGKNTNYNCEKFNLSELAQKCVTPLKLAAKKLEDLNALMPYVPLPWRNYFEKVLHSGDARHPSDQDNVDNVFQEEEDDDQPDY